MYFKNIPLTLYPFSIGNTDKFIAVKDITKNVRFLSEVLSNITLYDEYDMIDGETIEIVSEKFYGTPDYHWILMLCNERFHYIDDFVLSYDSLIKMTKEKYGESNLYSTHHYANSSGYIVDSTELGAIAISNIAYEESENEKKRRIKIIDSRLISMILNEFNRAITQ